MIVFRKLKNKVVQAISDEAQLDAPKHTPEGIVNIVLHYSSDEEIALPVVDDISDEVHSRSHFKRVLTVSIGYSSSKEKTPTKICESEAAQRGRTRI